MGDLCEHDERVGGECEVEREEIEIAFDQCERAGVIVGAELDRCGGVWQRHGERRALELDAGEMDGERVCGVRVVEREHQRRVGRRTRERVVVEEREMGG